jgi:hypothetical protein
MDVKQVIQSQYLASLSMLKQAIVKCPQSVWNDPQDSDKFWFKTYHALYSAHLYLKTTGTDYVRGKKHNKLELQFYNIRHIQQHTGELYERLSAYKNIKLNWVAQRHKEKK